MVLCLWEGDWGRSGDLEITNISKEERGQLDITEWNSDNDVMLYSPSSISSFLICVLEYSSDLWHLVKQRPTVLLLLFPFSENILVLTASHLSSLAIPELRTAQQNWGGGYQFIEESSSCSTPSSTPYSMTIPKPKSESTSSIQLAYLPIKTSCN